MQLLWLLSVTEVIVIFLLVFFLVKKTDLDKRVDFRTSVILGSLIFFSLFSYSVMALDTVSIDVEKIEADDWKLEGISLSLSEFYSESQKLVLHINQITLPEPLSDLGLFDIQCLTFSWQEKNIVCQQGLAKLKSDLIDSSPVNFSFSITAQQSHFNLQNVKFANGTLSINAEEKGSNWFVKIKSKGIQLLKIKEFLTDKLIDNITKGKGNTEIKLSGNEKGLKKLLLKTFLKNVSLQANDGQVVTESLDITINVVAKLINGVWHWDNNNAVTKGELYIAPVYLEIKDQALSLNIQGIWDQQGGFQATQVKYTHPDNIDVQASTIIIQKQSFNVDRATVEVDIKNLENFSALYVAPFFEQTAFEGIKFAGFSHSKIEIKQSKIQRISIDFSKLMVSDYKKRFAINNAEGEINWSMASDYSTSSYIQWDKLKLAVIPIGAGELKLLVKNKNIMLLEPSSVSLLGGNFNIIKFNWQHQTGDEPNVFFEGGIQDVSLQQLTSTLDWTPLSGTISGYIPAVDYKNKTLTVDTGLTVKVFDGVVKINKLASSGLFTDFARFSMDMEIDNLDLYKITQKFEIGGMEGRVSGFINNLYLENWQPVTFYAWLGTPENDQSRHRISQKAVENIASIGGGGAADIISKGFLRFFDSFGYDKLGFGCYLYKGVCQLMGIQAADKGYYIIKGGGIPRIDIIGYNPQVDWKVLMERLSRIIATDEVVIQ